MDFLSHWGSTKGIHVMAVDGIVTVNSLFTVAAFLGLTTTDPSTTLVDASHNPKCVAGKSISENLVSCHVYSFASFLFSSLIASALKQAIKFRTSEGGGPTNEARVNIGLLRLGIVVSATGSVTGCGFLMLALVALVEVKLGTLACWSTYSLAAVVPLVVLVPSALLIYVCIVFHAFIR
uniref:Maternal effect embryo arrest 60 n=1 Tax=Kalanchoe fedtschenkoi TaxID=63787 RepID=A0A7N0TDP0_KALFE